MSAETFRNLTERGVPMYTVGEDKRRIVVANFPLPAPARPQRSKD